MADYRSFLDRPLLFTDFETSGIDRVEHEIVEMGLVRADQRTLRILDTWETKVRPEHIETASAKALEINGYDEAAWRDAPALAEAIGAYAQYAVGGVLAAHNITFEWRFLDEAFRKTGVRDTLDYHRVCLFSIAWEKLRDSGLTEFNLDKVAKHLGLPEEPVPHRALTGAMQCYEVYKLLAAR